MQYNEIIKTLDNYNLDKKNFYIISGAALVLLGISNITNDIDISVSEEYYNFLLEKYDCKFERKNEFGKDTYMINNIINFGVSFKPKQYKTIRGYKVASLQDCYELKKFLNRSKDKEIIKVLEELINNK